MDFPVKEYTDSVKRYDGRIKLLDQTLYDLCRGHPNHSNPAEVHAKLWIIARTLASGLEKKVHKTAEKKQGGGLRSVEDALLKSRPKMDEIFGTLRTIAEPSSENLATIVRMHGELSRILTCATGGRSARSFVSKYMHFHNPVVPIYDSLAVKGIKAIKIPSPSKGASRAVVGVSGDEKYAQFVLRFYQLYEAAKRLLPSSDEGLTKRLDYFLIHKAEGRASKRKRTR